MEGWREQMRQKPQGRHEVPELPSPPTVVGSLAARGSIPLIPSPVQRLCLTEPTPPSAAYQNPRAVARSPPRSVDGGAAVAETGRNGEEPLSARCGWGLPGRRRIRLCGHGCWLDARFPLLLQGPLPNLPRLFFTDCPVQPLID
ncbi:hypothetical protein P7K49_017293 [Saguinus oedipus]|uniref:Uncharacterized protein n=1 Tax=Saguinus oedipus TaxID=9490 RepID=A0ABQ9V2J3_SAGOE|nr:hypothetical protein P7K49_017293 [Saguinus oedipus]